MDAETRVPRRTSHAPHFATTAVHPVFPLLRCSDARAARGPNARSADAFRRPWPRRPAGSRRASPRGWHAAPAAFGRMRPASCAMAQGLNRGRNGDEPSSAAVRNGVAAGGAPPPPPPPPSRSSCCSRRAARRLPESGTLCGPLPWPCAAGPSTQGTLGRACGRRGRPSPSRRLLACCAGLSPWLDDGKQACPQSSRPCLIQA